MKKATGGFLRYSYLSNVTQTQEFLKHIETQANYELGASKRESKPHQLGYLLGWAQMAWKFSALAEVSQALRDEMR